MYLALLTTVLMLISTGSNRRPRRHSNKHNETIPTKTDDYQWWGKAEYRHPQHHQSGCSWYFISFLKGDNSQIFIVVLSQLRLKDFFHDYWMFVGKEEIFETQRVSKLRWKSKGVKTIAFSRGLHFIMLSRGSLAKWLF
jgi:hypothetical protein